MLSQQRNVARIPLNFVFRVFEGGIVNINAIGNEFSVESAIPQLCLVFGFKNHLAISIENNQAVIGDR
jgi:hypothetical protein